MSIISLNPIIKTNNSIYLLGDIYIFEEKGYNKKLFIRTKCSKPKKVNRKCVLYVKDDFDPSTLQIISIQNNDCLSIHQAKIQLNKDQDFEFDLLDHLNQMNIPFSLNEGTRITYEDRYIMYFNNPSIKPYGVCESIPSRSVALEDSGDGYTFYFDPDYFNFIHHPIYSIKIHSYDINPIYHAVDEFIEGNKGDLTIQQFDELLDIIFEGNEVKISSDHFKMTIYRHYLRGIKVETSKQKYSLDLHPLDQRMLYPDEELPHKDEILASYKQLVKELFHSRKEQIADIIELYCQKYH